MPKLIDGGDIGAQGLQTKSVVRADTTDVSAGYHALAAGIGDLSQAAFDLQTRENQAQAKEASLWAAEQISDALYNPDTGYLSTRQLNAKQGYGGFESRLEQIRTEALGRVSGKAQELLDQDLRERMIGARRQGGQHLYNERVSYIIGTNEAVMDQARRSMAERPLDYGATSSAIDAIQGQAREIARLRGAGPEQTEAFVAAKTSEALVGQVTSVSETDPMAAEQIYHSVAGQIDPGDRAALGELVRDRRNRWQVDTATAEFRNSDELRDALKPRSTFDPKSAPGMVEPGNIDIMNRPRVENADGSISTVRSMSIEEDGKEVLIPTVSDDGRVLSDEDAIALYEKTGRHLGKFDSPKAATAYAEALHDQQAGAYGITPEQGRAAAGNAGYIYGRLTQAGIAPHIAAGIIGNLIQESGPDIDPAAVGDGGAALGIVQWNGPRKRALEAFAAERGVSATDLDTQIDFLMHEAQTSEAGAWAKVQSATSVEEATRLFSRHYERPGDPRDENRVRYSMAFTDKIGGVGVSDPRFAGMSAEAQERAFSALDRKERAALALLQDELTDQSGALRASVITRADTPSFDDLRERGLTAETARKISDGLDRDARIGGAAQRFQTGHLRDMDKFIRDAQARASDADNFEADAEELSALLTARAQVLEAVQKDPSGIILQTDATGEIAGMRSAVLNAKPGEMPGLLKSYARRLSAEQRARGYDVLHRGEGPILPVQDAAAIGQMLQKTAPADIGPTLLGFYDRLDDDLFGPLMEQFAEDGGLSGDMITMMPYADEPVAMDLFTRASQKDPADVARILQARDISLVDIRKEVSSASAIQDLIDVMSTADPEVEGWNQAAALEDLLVRTVASEVAGGASTSSAIKLVSRLAVDNAFTIINDSGADHPHRVYASKDVSEEVIRAAMRRALRPDRLAAFKPSGSNSPVLQSVAEAFYEGHGFFVTNSRADGVELAVMAGGVPHVVLDEDLKPYAIRFADIMGDEIDANAPQNPATLQFPTEDQTPAPNFMPYADNPAFRAD